MTPTEDRPLHGRVYLITGANTGIGRATAEELARRGGELILACRSVERGRAVAETIRQQTKDARLDVLELDLASFASIRRAAGELLTRNTPVHVLINNAGLAARGLTADGFELVFGVNHLGHFLFTNLLLERLRASAPARVVTVASAAHYRARGIDFEAARRPTATFTAVREYSVSKLANVLFSAELGRRLRGSGVTTYAVHPGRVASDIWRRIPAPIRPLVLSVMKTNEEGARPSVHCATAPEVASETSLYYDDNCRPRTPSRVAQDPALAAALWDRSAAWCGV
jgi:NAD(P)-dependent dehydrogenase (short-subunit alcohol dehydrogenase family)